MRLKKGQLATKVVMECGYNHAIEDILNHKKPNTPLTEEQANIMYPFLKRFVDMIMNTAICSKAAKGWEREDMMNDCLNFVMTRSLYLFDPDKYPGKKVNFLTICVRNYLMSNSRHLLRSKDRDTLPLTNADGDAVLLKTDPYFDAAIMNDLNETGEFDLLLEKFDELEEFYSKPIMPVKVSQHRLTCYRKLIQAVRMVLNNEVDLIELWRGAGRQGFVDGIRHITKERLNHEMTRHMTYNHIRRMYSVYVKFGKK